MPLRVIADWMADAVVLKATAISEIEGRGVRLAISISLVRFAVFQTMPRVPLLDRLCLATVSDFSRNNAC